LRSSEGSRRSNPGFSKSKDIDVASIHEIRDRSIFKRVKNRANVQYYIESGVSRPRVKLNVSGGK